MLISRRARLLKRAWRRLTQRKQVLKRLPVTAPPVEVPPRIELRRSADWPDAINVDWYNRAGIRVFGSCLRTPYKLGTEGTKHNSAFLHGWMPNAIIDATVRASK